MKDHCLICDAFLQKDYTWISLLFSLQHSQICQTCEDRLEPISGERCRVCSRSLQTLDKTFVQNGICMDCVRWEDHPELADCLLENTSIYHYNEFLKDVFALFKFRGDYVVAEVFAQVLKQAVKKQSFDWAVIIPLSAERIEERGFNQAEALARQAGVEGKDILRRVHTEKQSKKSRSERLSQKQLFQFQGNHAEIKGKTILLIDDIYTTGTTLRQAAKVLKQAGAKQVRALTVARG